MDYITTNFSETWKPADILNSNWAYPENCPDILTPDDSISYKGYASYPANESHRIQIHWSKLYLDCQLNACNTSVSTVAPQFDDKCSAGWALLVQRSFPTISRAISVATVNVSSSSVGDYTLDSPYYTSFSLKDANNGQKNAPGLQTCVACNQGIPISQVTADMIQSAYQDHINTLKSQARLVLPAIYRPILEMEISATYGQDPTSENKKVVVGYHYIEYDWVTIQFQDTGAEGNRLPR